MPLPSSFNFLSAPCCVLHQGPGDRDGKITKFTERSLATCQKTLKIRCHQDLKYKDVVIQNEINDTFGYHKSCYQKFNALSEHQRKKWKNLIDFETDACLNTIPETENAYQL